MDQLNEVHALAAHLDDDQVLFFRPWKRIQLCKLSFPSYFTLFDCFTRNSCRDSRPFVIVTEGLHSFDQQDVLLGHTL